MKNKIFLLLLAVAVFSSCERKIDDVNVTVNKGSADFQKYIAVGNSLMAGFADGNLYHSAQQYSIPNIIAGQLKLAGSGDFIQPVISSEFGLNYPGSKPKLVMGIHIECNGTTSLSPVSAIGPMDEIQSVGYPVNNFGIPGAKSFHFLFPGYSHFNPFYARFASSGESMVIGDIAQSNPTFFTLWLGDNDVLSYALKGGSEDSITSPYLFTFAMSSIVGTLVSNQAKGVIANIPDITAIPFFTTIPYNGLVLTQSQADSVNMAMGLYHLPYHYNAGPNPFLINDPNSTHPAFKVRQMKPGELVLLSVPHDSLRCIGMGIVSKINFKPYPIPDQFILDSTEIAKIREATVSYNQILSNLAATNHLGFVDMDANLKLLQKGLVYDGIHLDSRFVEGGAFSLDGIHLNPRGCAVAANFFIDKINSTYNSTIPHVNITQYPGIVFP